MTTPPRPGHQTQHQFQPRSAGASGVDAPAKSIQPFGQRLAQAMAVQGRLCVGLDPHPEVLTHWGLSHDAAGLKEFGSRVIAAAAGRVGVVKPQVAFYEAFGVAGLQVLAETIAEAKSAGLLVIADAKRGDIGSTMAGYAQAWLNPAGDFGADALTVSPFLGFGSLAPAIQAAEEYGAGLFVLALTSNPEGQDVQLATQEQHVVQVARHRRTVAGQMAAEARKINEAAAGKASDETASTAQSALGHIGLVIGATTAQLAAQHGIDLRRGYPPLLAPGYGAQGATADQMRRNFGASWEQVLVNSSRGILSAGPGIEDLISVIDSSRSDLE